ncbi:hypothetical protein [Arthrobacter mobilis]|uniref:Uncharacterized protein n=1 Tax=Arthrobacter mobilis TaxID=2724944 RepID=A0A7X6HE57_9MICC|nr:hypothetical protein [Arthrobacter mobilis]NKX55474.1 hypothetical protein [Arthrobacter mobilis]
MPGQHEHGGGHGGHGGHGTMGVHGMLLFGEDALYLSHLPMFQSPHNFQVILEVGFDGAAAEVLQADRETNGHGLYTFKPERFPITELDPGGGGPARSSVKGEIFQGHFERGGQTIARAVAEVRNVVCFQELDLTASHAPDQDLTYLCFGRAGQLHLAHRITASPDFDQVLTARLIPGTVTDPAGRPVGEDVTGDFDQAVPVAFEGRSDTPQARLAPQETVEGFFFATAGPTGSHGFRVQVETGRELYVELGELGSG